MVDGLQTFFPNSVATLAVLTVAIKAGCSFEVVSCVRSIFGETYSTNVPFCVKDVRLHFDCTGSHKPSVAENSRAILSSLCARQIVLIVAGCEFLDRSRSTRRLVRVRPLSLWHGANLGIPRATLSAL